MRKNKIKKKVSVIVVNYNNEKYLYRCLNSLYNQTNKNFEIIFVDDSSTDNSIQIAKEFLSNNNIKKFKLLINKKKTKFGSYNQINCILTALKFCKGEIISFVDSDDFFKNSKIQEVINFFKENKKTSITFDLSYKYYNKKNKTKSKINHRSKNLIPWPSFSSQSCISVKKKYLKKIIKILSIKKYPDVWFDFRLVSKGFYDFGELHYLNKYLTFYQQNIKGESKKFSKFSGRWWKRRREAHHYINKQILKNRKRVISADYYLTNLINLFFIKNAK